MCNASSFNTSLHCSYTPETQTPFLLLLMILEVVVGLPGNLLALWIFCFRVKFRQMKPATIFLFNLVLADILLLVSVPFRIATYVRQDNWVYGDVFCRINLFMHAVNRSASIGFMTIVALNRYFNVLHPLHWVRFMSSRLAVRLSLFIWVVVAIVRIPLLTTDKLLQQKDNSWYCRSFSSFKDPPVQIMIHYIAYITEFILPWPLLIFCSARIIWYLKRQEQVFQQRKFKKAIRSIVVINLVFNICFLPATITGLGALGIKTFDPCNCESFRKMALAFFVCIGLTYLNSTLDPVIYTFSSPTFRTELKSVFKSLRQ